VSGGDRDGHGDGDERPAILLSGGPMLDGHWNGELAGSGTILCKTRRLDAAGELGQSAEAHPTHRIRPVRGAATLRSPHSRAGLRAQQPVLSPSDASACGPPGATRGAFGFLASKAAPGPSSRQVRASTLATASGFVNARLGTSSARSGKVNAPLP
jgi:dihydroxy-acid dehydratase